MIDLGIDIFRLKVEFDREIELYIELQRLVTQILFGIGILDREFCGVLLFTCMITLNFYNVVREPSSYSSPLVTRYGLTAPGRKLTLSTPS